MKWKTLKKSGFALTELLAAAAIGIVAVYMIGSIQEHNDKIGRKIELRQELERLRQTIRDHFSCEATTGKLSWEIAVRNNESWTPAECPKDYVLKRKTPPNTAEEQQLLFPENSDGSVKATNGYFIRGSCYNPDEGLIIEYKREKNNVTLKDPVTNHSQGWINLFHDNGGMSFCRDFFKRKDPP